MNKALNEYSDDELAKEQARRTEEKRKAAIQKRLNYFTLLGNAAPALLTLIEHDRTSCNDSNPVNEMRCKRCYLLHIKKWNSPPTNDCVIEFSLINDPV